MATGDDLRGEGECQEISLLLVNPDSVTFTRRSVEVSLCETEVDSATVDVDLEFEWHQICHGCGERKWFSSMICDDCRDRHGV